jgi:hypothetical protein
VETVGARTATAAWPAIPRFFLGLPSLFYGVEHLLHPEYVALSSAAKAHTRMDPWANFLELFCWRDFDTRRRCLLVNKKGDVGRLDRYFAIGNLCCCFGQH